jgi:hypothetical protein
MTRTRGLLETAYSVAWRLGLRFAAPTAAHRAIFTRVYRTNEWGDAESRSGPGSTRRRGAALRPALLGLLARYSVSSMLDAPCGDFNWMRETTAGIPLDYTGVDVVEELIAQNATRYGDARHRFLCRDLTSGPLPRADLILCRDALVHFSFSDIRAALANFKRSGAAYLLATTFVDLPRNDDARTGGWRRINLQAEPFSFPEPLELLDDIPRDPSASDKRLGLWKL